MSECKKIELISQYQMKVKLHHYQFSHTDTFFSYFCVFLKKFDTPVNHFHSVPPSQPRVPVLVC